MIDWQDPEFHAHLRTIVSESITISDVLRKIGLNVGAGNFKQFHKYKSKLNIDTSHFIGCAHMKGKNFKVIQKPLKELLIENSFYSKSNVLKRRIVEEGLLEYQCDRCGINKWNNESIVLELHHKNSINSDNRIENLQILCPNCHSQTRQFCGRGKRKYIKKITQKSIFQKQYIKGICEFCKQEFRKKKRSRKFCSRKCANQIICPNNALRHLKDRPSKQELLNLLKDLSYLKVAKLYNVSDNTIRKWLKSPYTLDVPRRDA